MAYANVVASNFSGGETAPKMLGRSDLPVYKTVSEWMQNFIVTPQGPYFFRPGTSYVHHTRLHQLAVFIPFQFNDDQSYLIEATDQKFRFYKDGGIITESSNNISNISNTNPAVVTSNAHGYSNGNEVFIFDVQGMTEINGRSYIVAGATANTFQLKDEFGNNINAVSFGAYTSGGTAHRVYEIATPYLEADLENVKYAQNADTMYLVHRAYAPRKLTRTGDTSWTIATYVRQNDPFTGTNWPGAITFTSDGRLMYGGTTAHPETIYASRGPGSGGLSRYQDHQTGATVEASDALLFTLAPIHGKVDAIRWLSNTDKFIVCGTYGSVRRLYGAREEAPITPTDVNARSADYYGVSRSIPVSLGTNCVYLPRSGGSVRSVEFDYQIDGYRPVDRNLIADHILKAGAKQIVNQAGDPEILWVVRNDGLLIGLTYNDKENKYGWHRHKIADGFVEAIGIMPRENQKDQLWMIVRRTINGNTVRQIEYMTDSPIFPERLGFYTDKTNETNDRRKYENYLFETQKDAVHVDSSVMYDGSLLGLVEDVTLTPGANCVTVGSLGVSFQSDTNIFTSAMVGRQIWKPYDFEGNGGGRARIDSYISPTEVECAILSAFDNDDDLVPGEWYLTASNVSGLWHLEGEEVTVLNDGALHSNLTVEDGAVSLSKQASKIIIGLPYTGLAVSVPLDLGGQSGPAVTKIKTVYALAIRFLNSVGCSFGTDAYNVDKIDFRTTGQITGRPIPLFTGIKKQTYEDSYDPDKNGNKQLVIVQDTPFPCTVLGMEPYVETTDR